MAADDWREIAAQAYSAFGAGSLVDAASHFERLLQRVPDDPEFHYMQGLTHKYLRAWDVSLRENLRSLALRAEPDEASSWNAGIAATALGDWAEARRQWTACGIRLPEGKGAIEADYGMVAMRLNAWDNGETLYARRIDPARARILNVPLPESGYRYGDLVLHDGASLGTRTVDGRDVPVFNVIERLERSAFATFAAFIVCDDPAAMQAVSETDDRAIAHVEDWTESVRTICLQCSYGAQHVHAAPLAAGAWNPKRSIGIAASSRGAVSRVLETWQRRGIRIEGVETRDFPLPSPPDGVVWWDAPRQPEPDTASNA
jgi:hypothetical protein